jgi:hypothetical protein
MLTRRRFTWMALATAAIPLGGCGALVWDSAFPVPAELAGLVTALEEARTRKLAVQAAGDHLVAGGTLDDLYRALLLACVRQLGFDPLGFVAHPLWTLAPSRALAARGSASDAIVAALHVVDLFKLEQRTLRGDERTGPGELGAVGDPDPAALEAAVLAGDADAADAAAVALFRSDLATCRAALLRAGMCSVGSIGHVQVHTTQTIRLLDELGWDESVVRVLAWALAREAGSEFGILDPWNAVPAVAAALPSDWDAGADDPAGALALLAQVRTRDPAVATAAVADALADGLGVASVLDALAVRGSELALSHVGVDGLFPGIHTVTGLEGFRWILANSTDDDTRRRAILQAAALVGANDAEADSRSGGTEADVRLDALDPVSGASAADILDTAGNDRVEAAAQLLALVAAEGPDGFVAAQLELAQAKTVEEHHFKLPVAAWEAADAADPGLAGAAMAGALAFGPTAKDRDWDLLDDALAIADAV